MKPNAFKAGLAAGKVQLGLWLSMCSPFTADAVADIGFDWLLLDMEHAPNELNIVLGQLQALQPYASTALVRPMWNDPVLTKRLLDIGSPGLLFPMVQSVEEARAAVAACRYPPEGIRGVGTTHRANRFGRDRDYFAQSAAETCILVQVETREALEQVEAIATVPGIDGVFFGPADIAASYGKTGTVNEDDIWQHIFAAAAKVQALGVPTGTLVSDPARIREVIDSGFLFVAVGSDLGLLVNGAAARLEQFRG